MQFSAVSSRVKIKRKSIIGKVLDCSYIFATRAMVALGLAVSILTASPAAADVRTVQSADGHWQLMRDGKPWTVYGICRFIDEQSSMDLALECGANTLRTYGPGNMYSEKEVAANRQKLDLAQKNHVAVIFGIGLYRQGGHFDYAKPADLEKQRKDVRTVVRQYRDHPALLIWGLGNEAEGPGSKDVHEAYWKELEVLTQIVKEEDPHHPVMNVIAGGAEWKLRALKTYAPSIDIAGVNSYAGAAWVPKQLDASGWTKPFILTEYGPRGHWETEKTSWGAPVEPGSEAKAALYQSSFVGAMNDPHHRCLGGTAFVWGQKQETTCTWFGMFLESGEKTPAVDAMSFAYQGKYPRNRSPIISSFKTDLDKKEVAPKSEHTANVSATDPENDPLTYEWKVIRESGVKWAEGDREPVPPTIEGCIISTQGPSVTVRTPEKPGAYRLFVFIRDGKGNAATQNVPFLVK